MMANYSKSKKISKYLIYFSIIATSLSLITFLYSRNKISADSLESAMEEMLPENSGYQIVSNDSGNAQYILAKDINGSAIRNYKNFFYTLVTKKEGKECINLKSDFCYKLEIPSDAKDWIYASTDKDDLTPDFSFIREVSDKIDQFNNSDDPLFQIKYRKDKEALTKIKLLYLKASTIAQNNEKNNQNYWFETVLNQPKNIFIDRYHHPNLTNGVNSSNIESGGGSSLKLSAISWNDPQIPSEDWDLLSEAYIKAKIKGSSEDMEKIRKIQTDYQSAVYDNPNNKQDYWVSEDEQITNLYLVNASAPALQEKQNYDDLSFNQNRFEHIRVDHDGYWKFTNSGEWDGASLEEPYTPQWSFLIEILHRAEALNDDISAEKIEKIIKRYVADAYRQWGKVLYDINGGKIGIQDQNFFDHLLNKYPEIAESEECGDNCSFEKSAVDGSDVIVLYIHNSYPDAKLNSVWHESVLYILNSAIKAWEDVGMDMSEERDFIEKELQKYLSTAQKIKVSSDILSLEHPEEIYLENSDLTSYQFITSINLPETTEENSNLFVKFFLKPESKIDEDIFITYEFDPTNYRDFTISWLELTRSGYVDKNNQPYTETDADNKSYDIGFPQKYFLKVFLYKEGQEDALDEIKTNFQTVNDGMLSSSGHGNSANNNFFTISGPISAKQDDKIEIKVVVENTAEASEIEKVVLYACTGKREDLLNGTSDVCTYKTESGSTEDAIKGVAATTEAIDTASEAGSNVTNWQTLELNSEGKNEATFEWNAGKSIVGYHSLMAKGFDKNGVYIENSKEAITIMISNSDISIAQEDKKTNSGLISFGDSLFDINQPIKTFSSLFDRINSIYYWLVGILGFVGVLVGGFQYLTAGGNPDSVTKARKTILYTLLGIALASISYGVVTAVVDVVNQIF